MKRLTWTVLAAALVLAACAPSSTPIPSPVAPTAIVEPTSTAAPTAGFPSMVEMSMGSDPAARNVFGLIKADPEALSLVARQATGSMRDAISLLDQLASAGNNITLKLAQDVLGTATSQAVIAVVEAMIKRQSTQGLEMIHRSLDSGSDPRQFARQIVDYLRSLLLVAMGNASQVEATAESRAQMAQHAQAFTVTELLRVIQAFNQAAVETRSSWQPVLPLELAFIEAIMAAISASEISPMGRRSGGSGGCGGLVSSSTACDTEYERGCNECYD